MSVVKPFLLCASMIIASCSFCLGQDTASPSLALLLMEMAAHDRYESGRIGFAATKSKQYERFEQLAAVATPEQLLDLAANHKSGVVRLYALQAMQKQKIHIPESLQAQFKNDTTRVKIFIGCVMNTKPISALIREGFIGRSLP